MRTLIFILLLTLAVAIRPAIRSRDVGNSTVADVFTSAAGGFDTANDFDILTELLRDAKLISLLDNPSIPGGVTVFAPNDAAMLTSAQDIAFVRNFPKPNTEREAYDTIRRATMEYSHPNEVLNATLMFHMVRRAMPFPAVMQTIEFDTFQGDVMLRHGVVMRPFKKQVAPMIAFPSANLIAWHGASFKAINGYIHSVDRIIFPSMAGFSRVDQGPSVADGPTKPNQTTDNGATEPNNVPRPSFEADDEEEEMNTEPQTTETPQNPGTSTVPGPTVKPEEPTSQEKPSASKNPMPSREPTFSTMPMQSEMAMPSEEDFEQTEQEIPNNPKPSQTPKPSRKPSKTRNPPQSSQQVFPSGSTAFSVVPVPSFIMPAPGSQAPTKSPFSLAPFDITPSPEIEGTEYECFPASARVHLGNGEEIAMEELQAGHYVAVAEEEHSMVYFFSHRLYEGTFEFVRIEADNGRVVKMSKGHYIYANGHLTAAKDVRMGDVLRTVDGEANVVRVSITRERGLIAPHTLHGDIVVDGIVASTYTNAVHPKIAHAALWPVRVLVDIGIYKEPFGKVFYGGMPGIPRAFDLISQSFHSRPT